MWFIYGKNFGLKKTCASFGASTSASNFPLRRLNFKNKTRGLALIPIESSLGLSNLTKREDELVFSKTFCTIIINLQFNAITINKI